MQKKTSKRKPSDIIQEEMPFPLITENDTDEDISTKLILYEKNYFSQPLFFLNNRDVGTMKIIEKKYVTPHGTGIWRVSPNVSYGAGGSVEDLIMLGIHKILFSLPKPIKNPINIGSLRSFAKEIYPSSKIIGGSLIKGLKKSIMRIKSLLITTSYTFYDAAAKKHLSEAEGGFNIFDMVFFVGETLPDGTITEKNLIWLNEKYLKNINQRYAVPVDFDFYKSLRFEISKVLLKQLTSPFFANRCNKTPVCFKYSTLCDRTVIDRKKQFSKVKEQISNSIQELIDKKYASKVEFKDIPGVKDDWYINFWPGPRAEKYIKSYPKEIGTYGLGEVRLIDNATQQQSNSAIIYDESKKEDSEKIAEGIISRYKDLFISQYGGVPHIRKVKDKKIICNLLKQYDEMLLMRLLRIFMEMRDDPYIAGSGYTLSVFQTVINKLIIKNTTLDQKQADNLKELKNKIKGIEDKIKKNKEFMDFYGESHKDFKYYEGKNNVLSEEHTSLLSALNKIS